MGTQWQSLNTERNIKRGGNQLFSLSTNRRTSNSSHNLQQGKFSLDAGKINIYKRIFKHWKNWFMEVMESIFGCL